VHRSAQPARWLAPRPTPSTLRRASDRDRQ
jgi:hypothetical protein